MKKLLIFCALAVFAYFGSATMGFASSNENYEKLFDSQVQRLTDRGVPLQIVDMIRERKRGVLAEVDEMEIPEGNIPFIPVITPHYLSYYSLTSLVRNKTKSGYSLVHPAEIIDVVTVQSDLYFIYNVEVGKATLGLFPDEAVNAIYKQGRSPLTIAETLALATHTEVLSYRHSLWASGSRRGDDKFAFLWLFDGSPNLAWSGANFSNSEWGSASCDRRF